MARLRSLLPLALAGAALLALAPPATAAKPYDERLFDAARRDEERLLASERSQRFRDGWEKVIAEYAVVSEKHPRSRMATEALFRQGDLWRKLYRRSWLEADLDRAQLAFKRLADTYPKSRFAPAALMGSADVLETKGDKAAAAKALERLLRGYPRDAAAPQAKAKLAELAPFIPKPAPRERTAVVSSPRSAPAFSPVAPARPAAVEDIRFWSNPDYTRVVIYSAGRVAVKKSLLPADPKAGKPPRLTLGLSTAFLARPQAEPIPIGDGLLRQVRASQFDPRTVRIVLDIESVSEHQLFTLEDPSRVVVDVSGGASLPQAPAGGEPAAAGGKTSPPRGAGGEETLSLAQQLGLGVKRIVIDPGHGGDAPGAVGQGGLLEKDVTLAVARKMKANLEGKGYEVLLTREGDTSLRLEERTAFANQKGADLFISLHCNASRNRNARGIETYFLGVAKDRAASETALLENALREERTLSDLEKILLDLTRASKLRESSQLAERIQASVCERIRCRYDDAGQDKGVKQAPFYVLVGTRMPAVLAEMSYISHPEEEKLLADEGFRELMAQSLAEGVAGYAEWLNAGSSAPRGATP